MATYHAMPPAAPRRALCRSHAHTAATRGLPPAAVATAIAAAVAAALAALAGPARADSGTGADTTIANPLNPAGVTPARPRDPDGLGEAQHARTPTGRLIPSPFALRDPNRMEGGWTYRSQIEFGGIKLGGDRDAAKFNEYRSWDSGFLLTNAVVELDHAATGRYLTLTAGSPGRGDQFFGLTTGRYSDWRVRLFYNESDHVFTSTYRNLWAGTGGPRLTLTTLPAGPVAPATAATTDAAIGAAALATPYSTLSVQRRKGGVRLEKTLGEQTLLFASLGSENRQGARPFGLVSGGGGGTGGIEIPETVDYDTHEVIAGAQWHSGHTSVNLEVSASLFRNNDGTMIVDNPMFVAAANGITRFPQAVFDLAPDNELYNAKVELAHAIPDLHRARFTALFSTSSSRQNDPLIPQTPYAGAVVNGVAGGAWDTTASLSKTHAGARIDTRLIDLGATLSPLASLDVKAKLRLYETDNDTEYLACNPLTGQLGRLTNDGSGAAFVVPNVTAGNNPAGTPATAYDAAMCNLAAARALGLVPSAGNVNLLTMPWDYSQRNASVGAEWRVSRGRTASATVEREEFERSHRERNETWENRIKLGYVDRSPTWGTLRASLEHGQRRGSTYVSDPYDEFKSGSLGPQPTAVGTNVTSWIHINDLHRKFDLADRDSTVLNLRLNHALTDAVDVAVALQRADRKYLSQYGRSGRERRDSLNLDVNWQASPELAVYGYLSQQESRMAQVGLQQNACVLGTNYFFYSDGSVNTTGTLTPAQMAAGITVVGSSGVVTAANFTSLCSTAGPTSPLYPTSRAWTANQLDRNRAAGLGVRRDFGKWSVDTHVQHVRGRTSLGYTFNAAALGLVTSGAPTAAQLTTLALIGNGMPDMLFEQNSLDVSTVVKLTKQVGLRLLLRHERGQIRDWHYDGVAANPSPAANQQTYLDAGPQKYTVNLLGALLQVTW